MFMFSTKREIRHFHVVFLQRRPRNVQKSVMHMQTCFANINLLVFFFFPFSLPSPSSLLKLPNVCPPASLKLKPCSFVFCLFRKDSGRTTDKAVRV